MTVELAEGSTYYFIDPVLTNCALGHKAQVHDKRGNIWAGGGGGGTGHVRGATGHVRGGGGGGPQVMLGGHTCTYTHNSYIKKKLV